MAAVTAGEVTSSQARVGRHRTNQQIIIFVIMPLHTLLNSLVDMLQDKDKEEIANATGRGTSALTSGGPRRPPRACIPRGSMATAAVAAGDVTSPQARVGRHRIDQQTDQQITIFAFVPPHIFLDGHIDTRQDKKEIVNVTCKGTSALTSKGPHRPPRACIPRVKSLARSANAEDESGLPDRVDLYLNVVTYDMISSERIMTNVRQTVGIRGRNCSAAYVDRGPQWIKPDGKVAREEPTRGSASAPTAAAEAMNQLQVQWAVYTTNGTTYDDIGHLDIRKAAMRTPTDAMEENPNPNIKPEDPRRTMAQGTAARRGLGSHWTLLDGRPRLPTPRWRTSRSTT